MLLYHATCPEWKDKERGPVPRFLLVSHSPELATRTYKCNACGTVVHADMDRAEGVMPGKDERLD